jgi:hypothetical protein
MVVGFALGYLLLTKLRRPLAFALVAVVGALIGWQVLSFIPAANTGLIYFLDTATLQQMQLLLDQTHDLRMVSGLIRNSFYLYIAFNALAAIVGFMLALAIKRKRVST